MQSSIFWTTGSAGDGASPYTMAQLTGWIRRMLGDGVHPAWGNTLNVTGTSSPLSIDTGAAEVNGIPYENTAVVSLAVPTPTAGTTGHRVVLRANYTAQTVRVALSSSADGVPTFPALLTSASPYFEISLAQVSITTGGVITVANDHSLLHYNTVVSPSMVENRNRLVYVPVVSAFNLTDLVVVDTTGGGARMEEDKDTVAFGKFICPTDFSSSGTIVPLHYIAVSIGGDIRVAANYDYGAIGQAFDTHTDAAGVATYLIPQAQYYPQPSVALVDIAPGDIVSCSCTRFGTDGLDSLGQDTDLMGWVFSYTADS